MFQQARNPRLSSAQELRGRRFTRDHTLRRRLVSSSPSLALRISTTGETTLRKLAKHSLRSSVSFQDTGRFRRIRRENAAAAGAQAPTNIAARARCPSRVLPRTALSLCGRTFFRRRIQNGGKRKQRTYLTFGLPPVYPFLPACAMQMRLRRFLVARPASLTPTDW